MKFFLNLIAAVASLAPARAGDRGDGQGAVKPTGTGAGLRFGFRLATAALLAAFFTACGWMPWHGGRRRAADEKALAESRPAALVVGRVSLVNEGERFALIEENMVQAPVAGALLRIYSGNALSAELRATGVRRRPFLVADLVSGMPAKGDVVVQAAAAVNPPRASAVTAAATPEAIEPPRWQRWLGFFGRRK